MGTRRLPWAFANLSAALVCVVAGEGQVHCEVSTRSLQKLRPPPGEWELPTVGHLATQSRTYHAPTGGKASSRRDSHPEFAEALPIPGEWELPTIGHSPAWPRPYGGTRGAAAFTKPRKTKEKRCSNQRNISCFVCAGFAGISQRSHYFLFA